MKCVIKSRKDAKDSKDIIAGIQYKSIYKDERDLIFTEFDRDKIFYNYAIPPYEIKENGICSRIKELFRFWHNTSWSEMIYKNPSIGSVSNPDLKTHYDISQFGRIEYKLNLIAPSILTDKTRRVGGIPPGALTI